MIGCRRTGERERVLFEAVIAVSIAATHLEPTHHLESGVGGEGGGSGCISEREHSCAEECIIGVFGGTPRERTRRRRAQTGGIRTTPLIEAGRERNVQLIWEAQDVQLFESRDHLSSGRTAVC